MSKWNDSVQYRMLMDALNFSHNGMVGLPLEFINSCKAETVVISLVENGIVNTATDIPKKNPLTFFSNPVDS
jgi:hypothetical protein